MRRCQVDVACRVIVGEDTPDFRTISDFRKIHLARLEALFVEVLKLCALAGLAREYGLTFVVRRSEADPQTATQAALWVLLARYPQVLGVAVGLESNCESQQSPVVWTDDRSNLLEVLWRDPK
jgi:hypothetical protein